MIRPAVREDIEAMVALQKELFALEHDFCFCREKQVRGLQLLQDSPLAHAVVATEEHRVVGMATAQLLVSTAEGAMAMLIEDVIVHGEQRGKGHGRKLLVALAHWGRERGAHRMQLLADRTNQAAIDFYTGLGWSTTRLICLRTYNNRENQL